MKKKLKKFFVSRAFKTVAAAAVGGAANSIAAGAFEPTAIAAGAAIGVAGLWVRLDKHEDTNDSEPVQARRPDAGQADHGSR